MNRLGVSGLFTLINTIANRGKKEPTTSHAVNTHQPMAEEIYDCADLNDPNNPLSPFNHTPTDDN